MKLYIAGPMTGIKDFNHLAFNAAEKQLVEAGYEVLNPARQAMGLTWPEYMKLGIRDVLEAEGVATLPDWYMSRGANLEVSIARELGTPDMMVQDWLDGLTP